MYNRIVALLEIVRERGVTLGPSSLGALQSLVNFFCDRVCTASSSADLSPPRAVTGISSSPLIEWETSGEGLGFCLGPVKEKDGEDAISIPDSLPDLVDIVGEEGRLSPTDLVRKGVLPPGLTLYQDSVRPNRFWVH